MKSSSSSKPFIESTQLNKIVGLLLLSSLRYSDAFVPPFPLVTITSKLIDTSPSTPPLYMAKPKPLAKEGKWAAYLDEETTGLIYYFNSKTGESAWEAPTSSFPKVEMSEINKEKMLTKRKEYNQKIEETQKEKEKEEGGGFDFGSFFGKGKNDSVKESMKATKDTSFEATKQTQPIIEINEKKPSIKTEKPTPSFMRNPFQSLQSSSGSNDNAAVSTTTSPIQIDISSQVLPHPEKVSWGGEDAVFTTGRSFGVFDGVSGAEKLAGIPLYSKTLAMQMEETVGMNGLTVTQLQSKLLDAAEFADAGATGASTAIVASIGEDNILRALNLGDSYMLVLRDGAVAARTKEIVHYFDCPYQLADESPDRPVDGTSFEFELRKGDVIIAGSDGVFDNLTEEEISQICKKNLSGTIMAKNIINSSRRVSFDKNAKTPYAKLAKKARYEGYEDGLGGKLDDLSCITVKCT